MKAIKIKNTVVFPLLAAMLFSGCGGKKDDDNILKELPPISVKTKAAEMCPFESRLSVQGNLEASESVTVSARIPGNLDAVFVDVGDEVKKGETRLFTVDPIELENVVLISERNVDMAKAQLLVAEASLKSAEASDKKATLDAERYARLREEDRVSANEYEQVIVARDSASAAVESARAGVAVAQEQIASAEASLIIARRNLSDATVLAPIDGTVNERFLDPGERVNPGTPVLTLTGRGSVKAMACLPAVYYGEIDAGSSEFRLLVDGIELGQFKIAAKTPAVDTRLRTFGIRGYVDHESAVPGKMATFEVIFETRQGISVPDDSVLVRRNRNIVFVNENNTAVERVVKTGFRSDGRTEITEGLSLGDEVVVEGQTQLFDGRKIRPVGR
ncbi:MAG: efflux RND transporter periplasmic adaptor subunit [Lentisphaerae bacterium]|jgi:multidrug efflux pump subunit AcrA (membrane-fusion protein)|nr:efflux RND transporter periplasmic adaptor subunit [Lentisphaerota bacterium]